MNGAVRYASADYEAISPFEKEVLKYVVDKTSYSYDDTVVLTKSDLCDLSYKTGIKLTELEPIFNNLFNKNFFESFIKNLHFSFKITISFDGRNIINNGGGIDTNNGVFISYKHEELRFVELVYKFLVGIGVPPKRIFYSESEQNGIEYDIVDEVIDMMNESCILILIASKSYFDSPYCNNEAGIAMFKAKEKNSTLFLFGLPEIERNDLKGFISNSTVIRRFSNKTDLKRLSIIIKEKILNNLMDEIAVEREINKLMYEYSQKI